MLCCGTAVCAVLQATDQQDMSVKTKRSSSLLTWKHANLHSTECKNLIQLVVCCGLICSDSLHLPTSSLFVLVLYNYTHRI